MSISPQASEFLSIKSNSNVGPMIYTCIPPLYNYYNYLIYDKTTKSDVLQVIIHYVERVYIITYVEDLLMEITRPVTSIDCTCNKNHYIIHVNSKYHFTMHVSTVLYKMRNVKKNVAFWFYYGSERSWKHHLQSSYALKFLANRRCQTVDASAEIHASCNGV